MPAISPVFTGTSKTRRPNAVSLDYLTAFSPGPRAVGDSTLGIVNRAWKIRVDNATGNVYLAGASDDNTAWQAETLLFTFSGVPCLEVDLAFEQAARPVVVMERATGAAGASEVWLYWYDSRVPGFTFVSLCAGRTPRIILDYPPDVSSSDVQVFYMKTASGIMRRQQRDLYATEYATAIISDLNAYLDDVAYTRSFQVACIWTADNTGTGQYTLHRMESVPFPIPVGPDTAKIAGIITAGSLIMVVMFSAIGDSSAITAAVESGQLSAPVIFHTLYDTDLSKLLASLQSGSLSAPVIFHTLYDIDTSKITASLQSGALSSVVIFHTLYDVDKSKITASLQSGILA